MLQSYILALAPVEKPCSVRPALLTTAVGVIVVEPTVMSFDASKQPDVI